MIQKNDENVGDIVLTVRTLRYDEVDISDIPDEISIDNIDAAECEFL